VTQNVIHNQQSSLKTVSEARFLVNVDYKMSTSILLVLVLRLQNDLYSLGWGVKLYSLALTHSC